MSDFNFNKKRRLFSFLFAFFFLFNLASALPDDTGSRIDFKSSINYSLVNTNNSLFLLGKTWVNGDYPTSLYSTFNSSYVPYENANKNVNLGANNFTINSNTFFVNHHLNKVGINTTNPQSRLDLGLSPSVPGNLQLSNYAFYGLRYSSGGLMIGYNAKAKETASTTIEVANTNAIVGYQLMTLDYDTGISFYCNKTSVTKGEAVQPASIRMRITPDLGYVGVGTGNGNVTHQLNVKGNSNFTGYVIMQDNLNITNNVHIDGNVSFKRPYGMFSSTETQTIAVADTAYQVTFNWTEDAYQVYKTDNNFSFGQTGDYLIEISAIVSTDTANKHIQLWVQKNGKNVARSNTKKEFSTPNAEYVLSVPFILDMNMTDNFRVMWASDDAGTSMVYTTNTSFSPETPSIIMTISKISEITE